MRDMETGAQKAVLGTFKALVVPESARVDNLYTTNFDQRAIDLLTNYGVVVDFKPTEAQATLLREAYPPLKMITLFSREEREKGNLVDLISKQLLHYIEIYGLNTPGLFNLEMDNGKIMSLNYVQGITEGELGAKVEKIIRTNAPFKDVEALVKMIGNYGIQYDISTVANNELRVNLFIGETDTFANGDDAVRWLCLKATGDSLLIKSEEVRSKIGDFKWNGLNGFLDRHAYQLAGVFNRHKKLILATKRPETRAVINRISRLSKRHHVPIREAINKTFIARALADTNFDFSVLDRIGVRDKFRYLNLLEYKVLGNSHDVFFVRNGKVFVRDGRPAPNWVQINRVRKAVLASLWSNLSHLGGKNILLDSNVKIGLPISRKQAIGNLPYGSRVNVGDNGISAGIYWENRWGARDLDLSTINTDGNRVGWGQMSGYGDNQVIFSGDITNAPEGAMEFMTSKKSKHGLFVNIYSGTVGCKMEVVVGTDDANKQTWIDKPIIREETTLDSRGMVIGFVKNNEYVAWSGRLSGSRSNFDADVNPYLARGLAFHWTVNDLLDHFEVEYDLENEANKDYDYDLSYAGFSFDKLEAFVNNQ